MSNQRVLPVDQRFFNDGAWYVLSSTSLGNSGLEPGQIVDQLQGGVEAIQQLIAEGICLPLFFPGDCALDQVVVVLGDLTPEQEREWLGRIQSYLHIPCGELMLLGGGGCEEDWEVAIHHATPPNPHLFNFQKFTIPPGDYLVEVYAFLGSMNFNFQLEEIPRKQWQQWFHLQDKTKAEQPDWFKFLLANDYIDSEKFGLQEYIIRLSPLQEIPPLPVLDEEIAWCGYYQFRQPEHCPRGISRTQLLVQSSEADL
ncbi:hypothetical protein [Synechococcus elongatus]|uniref:Uncharacterized protein n=1 Tax=Synechococcus elongatus PCC 11802 TaxID=2283154 RepID=A0AAT9JUL0_SYNEL|nr:hypothetical protein [Synechococcus elongatus]QFZ93335.1 hypothetical protein EKO22_09090 [Synechococcus elongatus PCC 11802]